MMQAKTRLTRQIYAAPLAGIALVLAPWVAHATKYKVDPEHTSVVFKVRHLFTQVSGRFDKFDGTIDFDPNKPDEVKVVGTIDAASINTNQAKRDKHLRSKDFFNVEKYPSITFRSTAATDIDKGKETGKLHGNLAIHGVERPVVLEVSYLGTAEDPWGNVRAGFTGKVKISRKDFGLDWNEVLETGGLLVGDEVEIEINVEGLAEE